MKYQISPGLEMVTGTRGSNVYIIDGGQGLTLVDAGFPMDFRRIKKHVSDRGSGMDELKMMIATHYHLDHMGSMRKLKYMSGAEVAAHEEDALYMNGTRPYDVFKVDIFRTVYYTTLKPLFTYRYVEVDLPLNEGAFLDLLGGLEVIHTPGHTKGSIMLYTRERNILFSGDTIRNERGRIEGPPPQFTPEPELAWAGLEEKVFGLEFDILLPGHGDPIISSAGDMVVDALANRKSEQARQKSSREHKERV